MHRRTLDLAALSAAFAGTGTVVWYSESAVMTVASLLATVAGLIWRSAPDIDRNGRPDFIDRWLARFWGLRIGGGDTLPGESAGEYKSRVSRALGRSSLLGLVLVLPWFTMGCASSQSTSRDDIRFLGAEAGVTAQIGEAEFDLRLETDSTLRPALLELLAQVAPDAGTPEEVLDALLSLDWQLRVFGVGHFEWRRLKGDVSLEVDSRDGLRWCGGIRGLLASCSQHPWRSSDE